MGGGARGGTESIGGGLQLAPCIGGLFSWAYYMLRSAVLCPGNDSATVADCRCELCFAPPLVAYSLASSQSMEGARLLPGPFHFLQGLILRTAWPTWDLGSAQVGMTVRERFNQ